MSDFEDSIERCGDASRDVHQARLSEVTFSPSAALQREFREKYNWNEITDRYQEFLNKYLSDMPARAEAYMEDLVESFDYLGEIEYMFADRIIDAYTRWSLEDQVVVLWDVDYTMGGNPGQMHNGGDVKSAKWGFRPSFLALIEFLNQNFPEIKNGILSTRSIKSLNDDLDKSSVLGAVAPFIDREHIYTSYGEHEEKPRVLQELRSRLNVKSIDDDEELSKIEAANGSGVFFGDCPATEQYCVMIAKDKVA